jgi:hypothetical protein
VQSLERCQLAEAVLEVGKKLESPDAPLLLLKVKPNKLDSRLEFIDRLTYLHDVLAQILIIKVIASRC